MPRSFTKLALASCFLVLLFSLVFTKSSFAQFTVKGSVYVYRSMADTTTELLSNGTMIFYKINNNGQSIQIGSAPIGTDGKYSANITTNSDFYAVVWPDDEIQDSYVTTFWPGYLDFESTDILHATPGEIIEYDFGAVGKEIVERPSGVAEQISGTITLNNSVPVLFKPQAYIFQGENLITSVPVNADGTFSAEVYVSGEYELFVSAPGYASKSIQASTTRGGTYNVNLDFYSFEENQSLASTVNTYTLSQNYPNPFNPTTNIAYALPVAGLVKVSVYDISGKEVANLVNSYQEVGNYSVQFNASTLSSGMYFYKLSVGEFTVTKRMMLVK